MRGTCSCVQPILRLEADADLHPVDSVDDGVQGRTQAKKVPMLARSRSYYTYLLNIILYY